MLPQLEDQPLNRFSTPDLYAFPQSTQMTAAIDSGIARLEFDKKLFGGLIWMIFQPLMHLSPSERRSCTEPVQARAACC